MGWSSGCQVADDVWVLIEVFIPPKKKKEIARKFIDVFENYDCDTMEQADMYEAASFDDEA